MNRLMCNAQRGRGAERLADAEVAGESWVGAACDLHANAVPGREALGGGPERDADQPAAVGCSRRGPGRCDALEAVTHVEGTSFLVDVAEPNEHVEVLQVR